MPSSVFTSIDPGGGTETVVRRGLDRFASSIRNARVEDTTLGPWEEFVPEHLDLDGFSPHQAEMWEWAWEVEAAKPHDPFVGIWSRDHGKSTTAESIVAALGARGSINYCVYVSGTQSQADKHIGAIEELLTSPKFEREFPDVATPQVNRIGQVRGWRRNRLTTASGLVIDALGLDVKARGIKFGRMRPDFIILDDIDEKYDSKDATNKKEAKITNKILGTGTYETKVLAVQNLIKEDGIFDRIQKGKADYLLNARVSGPVKAVEDLQYETIQKEDGSYYYKITGGTPTWERMGLLQCEHLLNRIGITAFLRECQHEVEDVGGGIFDGVPYRHIGPNEVWEEYNIVRTVVAVDPAITKTDDSDCHALQVDGIAEDGTLLRFFSWEEKASPVQSLRKALLKAIEYGASRVIIETDQGGDTWKSVYERAWKQLVEDDAYPHISESTRRPSYRKETAASTQKSKEARGNEMLHDYEMGKIVHVTGTHLVLEKALNRAFVTKPYDLADAAFWAWNDLRNRGGGNAYDIN